MAVQRSPSQVTLRVTRTIAAPRERVWRAWTEAAALTRWFAPSDEFKTTIPDLDVRVGGRYRVIMIAPDGKEHIVTGRYVEVRSPERLVFTWGWESKGERDETQVTLVFEAKGSSTELTLTHERFGTEPDRDDHLKGWNGCLDRLGRKVHDVT